MGYTTVRIYGSISEMFLFFEEDGVYANVAGEKIKLHWDKAVKMWSN